EAQLVGAQELVAADQGDVALVLRSGLGAAEFVALDVGRLLVAGLRRGRVRRRRLAERRQDVADRAQAPVERLLVGHGGQGQGDAQGQGQQAQGGSQGAWHEGGGIRAGNRR